MHFQTFDLYILEKVKYRWIDGSINYDPHSSNIIPTLHEAHLVLNNFFRKAYPIINAKKYL
jgi:hypothetical protein